MNTDNYNDSGYLEGRLLIGTSILRDSCFEKSVVYMCAHNKEGAMGIIINRTLNDVTCSDIFDDLKIEKGASGYNKEVHFGGPVSSQRGFILHTSEYVSNNTQYLNNRLSISSTLEILKDMANNKGPKKSLVALGYAGWGAGQLEKEILENAWIYAPYSEEILFDTPNHLKLKRCSSLTGIDLEKLSEIGGNA